MITKSTAVLCVEDFMRQGLGRVLEIDEMQQACDMLHLTKIVDRKQTAATIFNAALQTLNTFCDPETSAHAQRLVLPAVATGAQLHLSKNELFHLRLAALLHDIGKVGIPASILHKPGPLDTDEWDIMQLHTQIGQDILRAAGGIFSHIAPIVVAHHEYWNGYGYPLGLHDEDIPLLARIVAVVDAYDAMISPRAYDQDKPLSRREASAELHQCAGQRYDPHVVAAFLAAHDVQNVELASCKCAKQHVA
jgi:HD-GYP domain-containing protein (c-di-GMP phosphodiesterase class II)